MLEKLALPEAVPEPMLEKLALPEAVPEDMPYAPVEEPHEVDYGAEIVPIEVTVDQAIPITKVELIPEPAIMPSMLDEIKVGLDTALFSTRNRASKVADTYR